MISSSYLWHVTLNTGHVRRSPRAEVTDDVMHAVGALLSSSLDGGAEVVPGYTARATADGGALTTTLFDSEGNAILTSAVAARSRHAPRLWAELHHLAQAQGIPLERLQTHGGDVPAAPWCADLLLPALAQRSSATRWTADFCRCVAWAWIDRCGTNQ